MARSDDGRWMAREQRAWDNDYLGCSDDLLEVRGAVVGEYHRYHIGAWISR